MARPAIWERDGRTDLLPRPNSGSSRPNIGTGTDRTGRFVKSTCNKDRRPLAVRSDFYKPVIGLSEENKIPEVPVPIFLISVAHAVLKVLSTALGYRIGTTFVTASLIGHVGSGSRSEVKVARSRFGLPRRG